VLRASIVQMETPDQLLGRVMSIHTLVVTSGPRLGDAEAAVVAALAGPQLSVISGGILCLLGLAAVLRLFPQLLSYEAWRGEPPGVPPGAPSEVPATAVSAPR
jgi:membrane protein YdbS with pleckstrin-like domain